MTNDGSRTKTVSGKWETPVRCPACHRLMSSYTATDQTDRDAPRPGDVAFCFPMGCGALMVINENLAPVLPDPDAAARYEADPRIRRVRRAMEATREAHGLKDG